jgi:glutathione S-transferase
MSPALGSPAYGDFMSLLHFMSTEIYPATSLSFGGTIYTRTDDADLFLAGRARERAEGYWQVIEKRLSASGPWLMGRAFSALDLYAFMLTLWARPSEEAFLAKFPAVSKLATAVRARPKLKAVLESHGVEKPGGYPG